MLSQEEWNRLVLEESMTDPDVQLVAHFASCKSTNLSPSALADAPVCRSVFCPLRTEAIR